MNADTALVKYAMLLDSRKERPEFGTIFSTLVLPRGFNTRLQHPCWGQVNHFNRQAHRFNSQLVKLCKSCQNVFFIGQTIHNFLARMVLAADSVHPHFAGVSLLARNIYNVILHTRRDHMGGWSDHLPTT
ncbi:hypothetical protein HPB51_026834 [Rhipicephalus microplus]|uniref:Uncharacterized protein n=1 Tax=Rhipicephalus microplus TaxID=6941 RepID=A0A9J6D1L2_RHIMP|nr:hypothetical protein HPB51_026834 [Rhipicephalus microplus]